MEKIKVSRDMDRDALINVAKTSLRTKVHAELADLLTEVSIHIKRILFKILSVEMIWEEHILLNLADNEMNVR